MTSESDGAFVSGTAKAARMEKQLAAFLEETSEELGYAECFDSEQRAELYTILQALISDTAEHQRVLGQWVSDRREGPADA